MILLFLWVLVEIVSLRRLPKRHGDSASLKFCIPNPHHPISTDPLCHEHDLMLLKPPHWRLKCPGAGQVPRDHTFWNPITISVGYFGDIKRPNIHRRCLLESPYLAIAPYLPNSRLPKEFWSHWSPLGSFIIIEEWVLLPDRCSGPGETLETHTVIRQFISHLCSSGPAYLPCSHLFPHKCTCSCWYHLLHMPGTLTVSF